jgi:hypothetical protein
MKRYHKILLLWVGLVASLAVSILFLPHKESPAVSQINTIIQLLLFVIAAFIVIEEPIRKNKYIFVNFACLFAVSFLFHIYNFVGPGALLFADNLYARLFYQQYISLGFYFFVLALAIVYLSIDALFRDFKTVQKYLIALAIAGGFFGYYYYPFFLDAKAAHHTQDILDWKTLDAAYREYTEQHGTEPTPEVLAQTTDMYTWRNGQRVGILFPAERAKRIQELFPYLAGSNYLILVYKPIFMNVIYMCVLSLAFILLFFGYQYMKDPPQGAYIEKIMFLFLVFCSLEILHAWSFVKSLEWQAFAETMKIGQYVSIGVLLLIALFFALRLRFITSVKGEFYEQELALSPSAVTRWRDSLDNLVIEKFFDRKVLLGRMFVSPVKK